MAKYRIVSFDGGGTLGALSLQLINRLAQQDPRLIRRTNVFAGNSIGSFIALALASGRSPRETLRFFKSRILPAYSVSRPGGPVFNQQLPFSGFTEAIETFFPPNLRLKNFKKRIVVPSFHLYFIKNYKVTSKTVFFSKQLHFKKFLSLNFTYS